MKETVLDVLIYLFDHYVEEELEINPDQQDLKTQLVQAGFADLQVDKAIDWLEGLATQKDVLDTSVLCSRSIRVFNDIENEKLDVVQLQMALSSRLLCYPQRRADTVGQCLVEIGILLSAPVVRAGGVAAADLLVALAFARNPQ